VKKLIVPPIRAAVFLGSESDFSQCVEGFQVLEKGQKKGKIEIVCVVKEKSVNVNSIHRQHNTTVRNLKKLVNKKGVDVIIAGAGMAAHLPGMLDSILRYEMRNDHVVVMAVAFRGSSRRRTIAATLSITEVPGTQVVFNRYHIGTEGFTRVCRKVVRGSFPKTLKLPSPKNAGYCSFAEAIRIGIAQREKKKEVK